MGSQPYFTIEAMCCPANISTKTWPLLAFSTSVLMSCHLEQKVQRVGDCITWFLTEYLIPLPMQHSFRDSGSVKYLNDIAVYCAALYIAFAQPSCVKRFWEIARTTEYFSYGPTDQHMLEIYPCRGVDSLPDNTNTCVSPNSRAHGCQWRPVLVFVHGGGWGCGHPWQYCLTADGIGRLINACAVVMVRYPTFPDASILQQKGCITAALRFLQTNAEVCNALERFCSGGVMGMLDTNGRPALKQQYQQRGHWKGWPVVLCGHSSGANIAMLACLDAVADLELLRGVDFPPRDMIPESHEKNQLQQQQQQSNAYYKQSHTPTPEALAPAFQQPSLLQIDCKTSNARDLGVRLFIGLSGVYDLERHYLFEASRGVHELSPMQPAGGGRSRLWQCSPTLLLERIFRLLELQCMPGIDNRRAGGGGGGGGRSFGVVGDASSFSGVGGGNNNDADADYNGDDDDDGGGGDEGGGVADSSSYRSSPDQPVANIQQSLDQSTAVELTASTVRDRLPPVLLVHGTADHVVPCSSSARLAAVLGRLGATGSLHYAHQVR